MNVKIIYFAAARDLASERSETLPLEDGSSVADLAAEVMKRHPQLKKLAQSVRYSVNLELVDHPTILREGDEVGVLPPVAGG